jgi:hypothetical protein
VKRTKPSILALFLAGCANVGVALPTLPPAAPGVVETCPEALLGPVRLQERIEAPDNPTVAVPRDGDPVGLVWARGFTADFDPLIIRDASGDSVARGGDIVWLTGGETPDGRYLVCEVSLTEP